MLNFLRAIPIYIKLSVNRIEITRLDNDETISQTATKKFSNERLIIADYELVKIIMNKILLQLLSFSKYNIMRPQLDIVIHQTDYVDGGLSPTEKRILIDVAKKIGGRKVVIEESQNLLKSEEAKRLLTKK